MESFGGVSNVDGNSQKNSVKHLSDNQQTICLEGNGSRPSHFGNGWIESDVMYTLNSVEVHQVLVLEHHPNDSRLKISKEDVCQTLSQRMGTGGGNVPMVMDTLVFDGAQITSPDNYSHPKWNDPCHPLSEEAGRTSAVISAGHSSVIRKLTPTECERLQGFPDGWTDIGEWTDSKGKKHKEADSPRYKALGNSIAVGYANNKSGFWCWLMRRISAQYERQATLGSLFDGIGGFPLAWESCGGKAVWASEIEEFCIAVTKKHFPEEENK